MLKMGSASENIQFVIANPRWAPTQKKIKKIQLRNLPSNLSVFGY